MATNEILQVHKAQWLFSDVTDFPNSGEGPPDTAANDLRLGSPSPTRGQLDLTSVAAAAARQSDKQQLSAAAIAVRWTLGACIEWAGGSLPDAGGTVDFYANFSPNTTAATGNSAGASGSDAAFTAANNPQLIFLGSMVVRNTAININAAIASNVYMPYRDLSIIVVNNTSEAFHTDMEETHIVLTANVPDIQAAA